MLGWARFETLVGEAERVLLTTHVRPDGDALGCELAMAELLKQRGKEVTIFNASPTPHRYRFLDPQGNRIASLCNDVGDLPPQPDLLIVLDTGTWNQLAGLADFVRTTPAPKVVIDHHVSQDDLGAFRLVDATVAACGMLVYEAFKQLQTEITPTSATALFVAIASDTGWMRHSNTTPEVLHVLGELVERGAQPHQIYNELFETNSLARLRLAARMLERLELTAGGKLANTYVMLQDIADAGAHLMDTEDFINFPMSVAGVDTALLFIEQKGGGCKVSFRSRGGIDCSQMAERFGGGGHKPAAGATMALPVSEARPLVLAAIAEAMNRSATPKA